MGDAGNWCLIESCPGVFSELIREFGEFWPTKSEVIFFLRLILSLFCFVPSNSGCDGVQVEELWSLDAENFKNLE
jgi:ubiquitin carboxyl-terminal hydrolase L5